MNDLDRDLSRVFTEHADALGPGPLTFDDVRGRATSIRRRRRVAGGLAVAAAVAVIVPTALIASKSANSDGPLPATNDPTATDTADPTTAATPAPVQGRPHALDVSDLPTGAPPGITILYRTGDDMFARATTGEAEVRWGADGVLVNVGATRFGPYPSSSGIARNAAGTAVAWATDEGEVMIWEDGTPEPTSLGTAGLMGVQVEALTGDGRVYVRGNEADGTPASLVVSRDGTEPVDAGDQIIQVRDADENGRVLGSTEITDSGSCSSVLEGEQTLLSTCDYQFDAFSPDGAYVLASEPYHSGIGSSTIAVFATAGDLTAYRMNRGPELRFYNDAVWEDETHVLFSMYQDGAWSVVRMGVDGAMEYAVAPQQGDETDTPFRFETR